MHVCKSISYMEHHTTTATTARVRVEKKIEWSITLLLTTTTTIEVNSPGNTPVCCQ